MHNDTRRARTAGSVRFDPYYKVQVWEPRSLAWRDIQRAFDSEAAARAAARAVRGRWRVMAVLEDGRHPLPVEGEG